MRRARWWSATRAESQRPRVNSERGFTLIEALIASLILTVGLIALADLLAVTIRMHQLGRGSTTATRYAQGKLEELMKLNFSTAPAIQITGQNSLDSNVANYFDTPASGYSRRWQVEAGPGGNAKLRLVTVRVIPVLADRRVAAEARITTILRSW